MLRLAIDFGGGEKGDALRGLGHRIELAEEYGFICKKSDLKTMIKHGIIEEVEEVQEPRWTDANMLAFAAYVVNSKEHNEPLSVSDLFDIYQHRQRGE